MRTHLLEPPSLETPRECFVPSAVEGMTGVDGVAIYPDRMELRIGEDYWQAIRFLELARGHKWGWYDRWRARWRQRRQLRVRGGPIIGERDWFHPPAQRFFRFDTQPVITIYLADEAADTPYGQTLFRRIQDVMAHGGFFTNDLG